MSSSILPFARYIAANVASLTLDTNLFIGLDPSTAPCPSVVIRDIPGGEKNWSGLDIDVFQIIVKDLGYIDAQDLAYSIYNILSNKPGFSDTTLSGENVLYCNTLNKPYCVDRDFKGNLIFHFTVKVDKK